MHVHGRVTTECYETLAALRIVYEEYNKCREYEAKHHSSCVNDKLF